MELIVANRKDGLAKMGLFRVDYPWVFARLKPGASGDCLGKLKNRPGTARMLKV
jgi:hypothetical protein